MSMLNKDFTKMNYEGLKNRDSSKSIAGKYSVEAEENFNRHLKNLNDTRTFNPRLFEKGVEYFNAGGNTDEIPAELKDNDSFMRGYAHAERLAQIEKNGSVKGR